MKVQSVNDRHQIEDKLSIQDFKILGLIAEGSYAEVFQAIDKSNKIVTLKRIFKSSIIASGKQNEIYIERFVLANYTHQHDGMIKFYGCFQDDNFLYFVLENCSYGDLDMLIQRNGCCPDTKHLFKQYIKQIVEILYYLHSRGIAHLDLKPQNLVIDDNYNLKLIDFSTCYFFDKSQRPKELSQKLLKHHMEKEEQESPQIYKTNFVGTPQYISPEMLEDSKASKEADLWALGVIIYQIFHGVHPFNDDCEMHIFNRILNLEYTFDQNLDLNTKDLIQRLLVIDPSKRLGSQNIREILDHPFFYELIDYKPWIHPIRINQDQLFIKVIPDENDLPFVKRSQKRQQSKLIKEPSTDRFPTSDSSSKTLNNKKMTIQRIITIRKFCFDEILLMKIYHNPKLIQIQTLKGRTLMQFEIDQKKQLYNLLK
ncbi:hypothetical protein pb186bvf_002029 [Paramecium bursaria]